MYPKPKTQNPGPKTQNSVVFGLWSSVCGLRYKILLLAVFLWLAFGLAGRALRHIAIGQLAEITNAKVSAESIDFNLDGSVFIEKLILRPYRRQSYDNTILRAETVYAHFGIGSLLLLHPRLKEVTVNDFIFDAQYDLDANRWNVAELKVKGPPKGRSGRLPVIRLEKGILRYSKISDAQVETIAEFPVNAGFGPARSGGKPGSAEKTQDMYSFEITTAPTSGGLAGSTLRGFWRPGSITLTGGISSTDIPAFEETWAIDVIAADLNYDPDGPYSLKLGIKNLSCEHGLHQNTLALVEPLFPEKAGLFTTLQSFFSRYQPAGQADINIEASGTLQQPAKSRVVGRVYCKDASIFCCDFPYLVENLAGCIDFTEKSISFDNLRGQHNNVEISFDGWSENFGDNRQYQFRITSNDMSLDDDLYQALTPKLKEVWSVFSPVGAAAIEYRIGRYSKTDKKVTLAVQPLGADAEYRYFPYPMKNLAGTVFYDGSSVTISDLVSRVNDRRITLNGSVTSFDAGRPIYDISIRANNVPLDSTLVSALPAEQGRLYSRFDTSGLVHIENLIGRIWSAEENAGPCYHLTLDGEQIELAPCLFAMLSQPLEKFVRELQPKGKVNINVDLYKAGTTELPDYEIIVDCLGDSICFERFPYPLEDITGSIAITKDRIEFRNIAASVAHNVRIMPEPSSVRLTGRITLDDNFFGGGQFRLSADDIFLDQELGIAVPEDIRPFYARLAPAGRFDLDFENIEISNDRANENRIDFAGNVKFKDCNFNTSPAATQLNAVLKIKGSYKTGSGFCSSRAFFLADTLRIKGKSLTALKADIDYDPAGQRWVTENLVADCYDGVLAAKFEFKLLPDSTLTYVLQTGFEGIDLNQFLSDTRPAKTSYDSYTTGRLSGSLSVSAEAGNSDSRIGRCRLAVNDMRVGRLSPLAKLLSVLKLTEPTDFAFERMFIDSYIKQNELFFERFDLAGTSVAFNGSGWMDMRSDDVDLTLTARGRRLATAEPSLFQSLTEGLGHAVVRMNVTGNVYDPQVTTRALPVIKDSLRLLGTKPPTQKQ